MSRFGAIGKISWPSGGADPDSARESHSGTRLSTNMVKNKFNRHNQPLFFPDKRAAFDRRGCAA
jgi:hypothetical protein